MNKKHDSAPTHTLRVAFTTDSGHTLTREITVTHADLDESGRNLVWLTAHGSRGGIPTRIIQSWEVM